MSAQPTQNEILAMAKEAGIVTGENLRFAEGQRYRSLGAPCNVTEEHLLRFAELVAANKAPQQKVQAEPVVDERDAFERVFPRPSGCIRVGTGYASEGYSNWAAHTHCNRWEGWKARAAIKAMEEKP